MSPIPPPAGRQPSRSIRVAAIAVLAGVLSASGWGAVGAPAAAGRHPAAPVAEPFALPGGEGGIGFDDLKHSTALGRILVPAGRSGNLDLVDPATRRVETIGGFSAQSSFVRGHGDGTTSADSGRGHIFASDRTAMELVVVDAASRKVVARAKLASSPDYVRWVEPTGEVWVTEPDKERIEIFALPTAGPPVPRHQGFVAVPGGPESLVVDAGRGRAYTNLWNDATVAVDLTRRAVVARWSNGCRGSRGIALDASRGFLVVGCEEGKAVVLDAAHDGAVRDSLRAGVGVDIIDYSPRLHHLYVPGGSSATLAILGVSAAGKLSLLGSVKTARSAHCVAADDRAQAWVCDPGHGRLLLVRDPYPALE